MVYRSSRSSSSSSCAVCFLCGHLRVVKVSGSRCQLLGRSAATSTIVYRCRLLSKAPQPPGVLPWELHFGVFVFGFLIGGGDEPAALLRSLLLLAGDVHPNPGPSWPCPLSSMFSQCCQRICALHQLQPVVAPYLCRCPLQCESCQRLDLPTMSHTCDSFLHCFSSCCRVSQEFNGSSKSS